ncbi:matrixin family metalloprotease [Runella aurantiaca]|uniref:Peptidase M10 metallopeptidase domain-containing protein n=1 Tax=Runella aurantiaca TaxID=2282308 RepID=A0A369IH46_9BACT|nr:matrixin family metalloprotease [Runella aurantiaca]RDB07515.1 hypothetical protein DVG78_00145 [Runella aurantiaca]
MKRFINYLLLGVLSAGLGCETKYLNASPELYLGTNDNFAPIRRFESCTILYSMTNFTSQIDQTSQQTALKNTAELWGQAHGYLELKEAAGRTPAITVTFTDSASFTTKMTKEGLVSQPLRALSMIKRTTNGCSVLLRKSYDWKLPVLQRVLLYQMGVALGLQDSNEEESAMSLTNSYGKLSLSKADSTTISNVYNQPCDEWTKIDTRLFLSSSDLVRTRATFSNQSKGYCIIDLLNGVNKVVEFDPASTTGNWIVRKPFPGLVAPSSTRTLVTFTIENRMFVGNLYSTQVGKFWEYIPAKGSEPDSWQPIADCPLMVLGGDAQAFGVGKKGYVIYNVPRVYSWRVWGYAPLANKWSEEPELTLANSGTLRSQSDITTFSIDSAVYLMPSYGDHWRFSPSLRSTPWQKINPLQISDSFYPFSTRNTGFLFRPYSTQLWRFNEKTKWQLCNSMPERLTNPYFSFSIAKRVFICWNTETFYRYNP